MTLPHAPQYRAPRRHVRTQTIVALMYATMEHCVAAREAGREITSAHAHTGAVVVTTRPATRGAAA
jgi:hypothetical protein